MLLPSGRSSWHCGHRYLQRRTRPLDHQSCCWTLLCYLRVGPSCRTCYRICLKDSTGRQSIHSRQVHSVAAWTFGIAQTWYLSAFSDLGYRWIMMQRQARFDQTSWCSELSTLDRTLRHSQIEPCLEQLLDLGSNLHLGLTYSESLPLSSRSFSLQGLRNLMSQQLCAWKCANRQSLAVVSSSPSGHSSAD